MPLTLFDWTHLAALSTMLVGAIWHDVAMRRIPNNLLLWGGLTALGLSLSPHGIGLGSAIAGGMVGFFGFLVFYLLRMLGAGLFWGTLDMGWKVGESPVIVGGQTATSLWLGRPARWLGACVSGS